jgi:tripartite-type tricarboxylate transporter receptor subunit TctC
MANRTVKSRRLVRILRSSMISAAFALGVISPPCLAQVDTFPTRSISILVPFPPGSTADLVPRAIAPLLAQSMGVAVVVENQRIGVTGAIGAAFVAKAPADGHLILMSPLPVLTVHQWLHKTPLYDPEKDFAPIINAASTPNMLVVHPSVPAKTLTELIALAKAKPNALTFASGGNGSTHHLCVELLKTTARVEMVHVPYKGPAPALQDVVAGHVPLMCDNFSNAIQHVRSGRLHAIALTAKTRHRQALDIPTADESGLPGFEAGVWYGFVAPAATPRAVIDKLNAEFTKALRSPAVIERLDALGLVFTANSADEFKRFVAAESSKWRKVVEASGAKVD